MSQAPEVIVRKLEERAAAFRKLSDESTHRTMDLALQRTYASLRGAAELAAELLPAASAFTDRKVAQAKQRSGPGVELETTFTLTATAWRLGELLESAELLSKGKDADAIKHMGLHAASILAKIAARLSGIALVQDLVELLQALEEAIKTGQVIRLRKQQVRAGSDFLKWAEAVTLVSLVWSYGAQQYLLATQTKGATDEDAVLDLVLDRMTRASQTWHDAPR